jgi:hypothetical protein
MFAIAMRTSEDITPISVDNNENSQTVKPYENYG